VHFLIYIVLHENLINARYNNHYKIVVTTRQFVTIYVDFFCKTAIRSLYQRKPLHHPLLLGRF
jgi:hypothetical protein